jgi:anthranilate synthase/aminodeoxychorismate synthase-like glutamine amidotransferase
MLLIIDNYDSFTYNLFQYFSELGEKVMVFRNDKTTITGIEALKPDKIVISPGPSTPQNAGISNAVIKHFSPKIPMLGVCLGHECIGYCYGGTVGHAPVIMHGKSSKIFHNSHGVFKGINNPFSAVRYHSLAVSVENLPACLEITAWTEDGTIMGMRHKKYPLQGVQFHPESFMTEHGKELLGNFLREGKGARKND